MLWHCSFTWQPGTSYQQVAQRLLAQQEAINAMGKHLRGWYNLVGGGAGFMILEADDPHEVNLLLQPWMDIVSWDVRAIVETSSEQALENARRVMPSSGS